MGTEICNLDDLFVLNCLPPPAQVAGCPEDVDLGVDIDLETWFFSPPSEAAPSEVITAPNNGPTSSPTGPTVPRRQCSAGYCKELLPEGDKRKTCKVHREASLRWKRGWKETRTDGRCTSGGCNVLLRVGDKSKTCKMHREACAEYKRVVRDSAKCCGARKWDGEKCQCKADASGYCGYHRKKWKEKEESDFIDEILEHVDEEGNPRTS